MQGRLLHHVAALSAEQVRERESAKGYRMVLQGSTLAMAACSE